MSFTHKVSVTYTTDAGAVTSLISTYTGDAQIANDVPIAANTTNYEIDIAFPYSTIKSCELYSDKANLTVKTNSTSAPGDTKSLTAGKQIIFNADGAGGTSTNPFTADVTKLYVTNADLTNATTLKIRVLWDSTPA